MKKAIRLKEKKILEKVLASSKNIAFQDAIKLAQSFGFKLDRGTGSHHILVHDELSELINLQNVKGQVKHYQLKQLVNLIERYDLKMRD